jgi:hypothetical protein
VRTRGRREPQSAGTQGRESCSAEDERRRTLPGRGAMRPSLRALLASRAAWRESFSVRGRDVARWFPGHMAKGEARPAGGVVGPVPSRPVPRALGGPGRRAARRRSALRWP